MPSTVLLRVMEPIQFELNLHNNHMATMMTIAPTLQLSPQLPKQRSGYLEPGGQVSSLVDGPHSGGLIGVEALAEFSVGLVAVGDQIFGQQLLQEEQQVKNTVFNQFCAN